MEFGMNENEYKFWINSKDVTRLIDALEGRIDKIYIGCKPDLRLEVSKGLIKADFYIEPTLQAYILLSTFYVHSEPINDEEEQYILFLGGKDGAKYGRLKIYVDGDEE